MTEKLYQVQFTAAAKRQLRRLDKNVQARILRATSLLRTHPRPPAARRLAGNRGLWRIRTGDYRIIYRIEEHQLTVAIARVGHRSVIYRNLDEQ